jgi:uncharacterized protein (DUF2141 family)
MYHIIIFSLQFFVITSGAVHPVQTQNYTLNLIISDVESADGYLFVALCNDASSFMNKSFKQTKAKATQGKVTIKFVDVPAGMYAVRVFHDKNSNNKLDLQFLGFPAEPYGFSNDAKISLGPPSFRDAAFHVHSENQTIQIKLVK